MAGTRTGRTARPVPRHRPGVRSGERGHLTLMTTFLSRERGVVVTAVADLHVVLAAWSFFLRVKVTLPLASSEPLPSIFLALHPLTLPVGSSLSAPDDLDLGLVAGLVTFLAGLAFVVDSLAARTIEPRLAASPP